MKLFYWDFLEVTLVGESYNKKLGMGVIAEKVKIRSYLHIGKNPYLQVVS